MYLRFTKLPPSFSERAVSNCRRASSVPSIHQTIAGRKRFYKFVEVNYIGDNQFGISLDGKLLKTPARNNLTFESMSLATAVAIEWDTQGKGGIQPINMPLMSLASTAIDQILPNPVETIANCMRYLPTDTSLFFTTTEDRILLDKQKASFSPAIDFINTSFDVNLQTTENMAARIIHDPEVIHKLTCALQRMDPFTLACLQSATFECKSLVLALAFIGRYLSLAEVQEASRMEEEFQAEIWGVVEGGHDLDRLNNAVRLSSVGLFMNLYLDRADFDLTWKRIRSCNL